MATGALQMHFCWESSDVKFESHVNVTANATSWFVRKNSPELKTNFQIEFVNDDQQLGTKTGALQGVWNTSWGHTSVFSLADTSVRSTGKPFILNIQDNTHTGSVYGTTFIIILKTNAHTAG